MSANLQIAYSVLDNDLADYAEMCRAATHRLLGMNRIALHPTQRQIKSEARRFNVLCCGRRFGKSWMLGDLLAEAAEPGYPVGYFAPTYKLLLEAWRDIKEIVGPLIKSANDTEHRIELKTGGVIEAWSLDSEGGAAATSKKKYKAGRSRKYKRVAIDEAALVPDLENIFDYAIAPTLMDFSGDAWFASTPSGKGAFYRFWLKGQPGGDPEWKSWQVPSSANPYMKMAEIEGARRRFPSTVFSQEYLAEFLDDGGAVFRNITACTVDKDKIWQEHLVPYHVYAFGWDLAKKEDFSVITVVDCTTKSVVHIDRFNQVEYMLQIPRLVALAEAFQPAEIVVEVNANLALIEVLRLTSYNKIGPAPKHGIDISKSLDEAIAVGLFTRAEAEQAAAAVARLAVSAGTKPTHRARLPITEFTATNASKEEAIQALVLAFERREIKIPKEPALLAELEVFGMERLPSGRFRYAAPPGEHDDTVLSLAECWYKARRYMSEEALPLRMRAIRQLDESLRPENIEHNPHPMAANSQQYHIQAIEKQLKKKQVTHFMDKLHGGR